VACGRTGHSPSLKSALGDGNYLIAGQANANMKPKMASRILATAATTQSSCEQQHFWESLMINDSQPERPVMNKSVSC
jgi:hypothetical protein